MGQNEPPGPSMCDTMDPYDWDWLLAPGTGRCMHEAAANTVERVRNAARTQRLVQSVMG